MEDSLSTHPVGFDKSGRVIYLIDSRGRDTAALKALNLDTGDQTLIAEHGEADAGDTLIHPTEKTIQAVFPRHGLEFGPPHLGSKPQLI